MIQTNTDEVRHDPAADPATADLWVPSPKALTRTRTPFPGRLG